MELRQKKSGRGIAPNHRKTLVGWMWGVGWEGEQEERQPEGLHDRGQARLSLTLCWGKLRGRAWESVSYLFCKFSLVIWRLLGTFIIIFPPRDGPLQFSAEWFIARVKILGNCLHTKNMLPGSKQSITLPHETHVFPPNLRLFFKWFVGSYTIYVISESVRQSSTSGVLSNFSLQPSCERNV